MGRALRGGEFLRGYFPFREENLSVTPVTGCLDNETFRPKKQAAQGEALSSLVGEVLRGGG